jgi:hypothetical protein
MFGRMRKCFVIQPFDKGRFDKRYSDVFAPAIVNTKVLEPYRVDRDPAVSIPIEEIEKRIRESAVCLADITLNNPNVWYEVCFAFASKKEVVLLSCSSERDGRYPFDIQHRTVIDYPSDSPSDFTNLGVRITERLLAVVKRHDERQTVAELSPVKETAGLHAHEVAALIAVTEGTIRDETVPGFTVKTSMNNAGYNDLAVGLSLKSLVRRKFLTARTETDSDGYNTTSFTAYALTDEGEGWLSANQERLELKSETVGHDYYRNDDEA